MVFSELDKVKKEGWGCFGGQVPVRCGGARVCVRARKGVNRR